MNSDDSNDDSLKKLEDFNEHMLKATAVTFSTEGLNKDLECYLQKKITLNNRTLKHLIDLIRFLAESDNKMLVPYFFNKKNNQSSIEKIMNHLIDETIATNGILNYIIQNLIAKENNLESDIIDESKPKNKHIKKE